MITQAVEPAHLASPGPKPAPLVVVDTLVKSYPNRPNLIQRLRGKISTRSNILDGVSLSVDRGEMLGLLGSNGAGKTTLLHSLAALAYWDSGTITIDGIDARNHPMAIRRIVGLSTVDGGFYGRLTVRENLRFFATLYDVPAASLNRRCNEVLDLVNLGDRAQSQYRTLSTGMRQRLTVARSLLSDPKLLLLDEPTRAVDPVNARMLHDLIRHTLIGQLGKTVILATNVLDEAWELCDRVAVLRKGHIAAVASPKTLQNDVTGCQRYRIVVDRVTDDLLGRIRSAAGVMNLVRSSQGENERLDVELSPLHHSLTELLQIVTSAGVDVRDVSFEGSSPADIFAALTTG